MNKFLLLLICPLFLIACSPNDNRLTGYAEGEYIYVAPSTGGTLVSRPFNDGDKVKRGAEVFSLDVTKLEADVAACEAALRKAQVAVADLEKGKRPEEIEVIRRQLDEARAKLVNADLEYKRSEVLLQTNTVSQSAVDALKMQYESAEANVAEVEGQLAVAALGSRVDQIAAAREDVRVAEEKTTQARQLLAEARPTAPADGTIERMLYHVGEYVPAGSPVVMMLPRENIKIRFFVMQEQMPKIKLGQTIEATADGIDKPIAAKVSFISSQVEFTPPVIYSVETRDKLIFMIEARPTEYHEELRPGLPLDIRLK